MLCQSFSSLRLRHEQQLNSYLLKYKWFDSLQNTNLSMKLKHPLNIVYRYPSETYLRAIVLFTNGIEVPNIQL